MLHSKKTLLIACLSLMASCVPQVELTTSWSNKTAQAKPSPKIMVMAFGKELANRQHAENYLTEYIRNAGYNAIGSLEIFNPGATKYDSLAMVNLLRQNNIDMLLTNAIVDIKETQHYVPGTTETVPTGNYAVEAYPYYNSGYYHYYDYRSVYYQTTYETRTTEGYTFTDVEVLIESNLYDVETAQLLWIGQSKSYSKEPTHELFESFSKVVVDDIIKNNFLKK